MRSTPRPTYLHRLAVSALSLATAGAMVFTTAPLASAQQAQTAPPATQDVPPAATAAERANPSSETSLPPARTDTSLRSAPMPADAAPLPAENARAIATHEISAEAWTKRPPANRVKVAPPKTKWTSTQRPKAAVAQGAMRSDREEIPEGFTKAEADKAETMEAALTARQPALGARATLGCQVYWPAPYQVCGAIRDKYNSMGGPNSFLLWPKTNELTNPDGIGKRTEFQNGPIYWSPQGGAHPVVNHFLAAWARHGYENSYIGYPTTDEIVNPDGVGRRQHFTGSTIYWSPADPLNAYSIGGAIADKWHTLGAERGLLGYPLTDERILPDGVGRMNRFQNGTIYWHPTTGAQVIENPILTMWSDAGFELSQYGYPTGPQYFDDREELVQPFQNGILNLGAEAKKSGYETFLGKEVSVWVMDQLRLLASDNGFDLEDTFTPMSNARIGPQVTPDSAPFPQNPNTGGIEIPADYHYTGVTGDHLHDFCSRSPDEFPAPGINANFRGACAIHDICYDENTAGRNGMRTCDSNFRNNLMRVCEGVYQGFIENPRRQSCRSTALGYYAFVVGFHHDQYI